MRRVGLIAIVVLSVLIARAAPAQPSALERAACTGPHTEDYHLLPCLSGDAGPLYAFTGCHA